MDLGGHALVALIFHFRTLESALLKNLWHCFRERFNHHLPKRKSPIVPKSVAFDHTFFVGLFLSLY